MGNDAERLRVAVERKLQPPVELLLGPSLLATERSFEQLQQSQLFESQRQATLGGSPAQAHVGNVHVPATMAELLTDDTGTAVTETRVWEFFRGKARGSDPEAIEQFLNRHDITKFEGDPPPDRHTWEETLHDAAGGGRLADVIVEAHRFVASGGVMLARTSASIEQLRDAGTTTIDVGTAPLTGDLDDRLARIGYPGSAAVCAFGVRGVDSTVAALTGELLEESPDVILYCLGG